MARLGRKRRGKRNDNTELSKEEKRPRRRATTTGDADVIPVNNQALPPAVAEYDKGGIELEEIFEEDEGINPCQPTPFTISEGDRFFIPSGLLTPPCLSRRRRTLKIPIFRGSKEAFPLPYDSNKINSLI
jgi:hypothetical protein